MSSSGSHSALVGMPPRRWYRLHRSTCLIALILSGVFVIWNFSGFVRSTGEDPQSQEWQNGWPGVYLQRHGELSPPAFDEDSAGMTRMQSLDVSNTQITDRGLRHLQRMVRLETLELNATRVGDVGLAGLRWLSALKRLGLTNNPALSDEALRHLAALDKLEILTLGGTSVTDAGLANLRSMKRLKFLDLHGTQVTDAGVAKLQKALPKCRIVNY